MSAPGGALPRHLLSDPCALPAGSIPSPASAAQLALAGVSRVFPRSDRAVVQQSCVRRCIPAAWPASLLTWRFEDPLVCQLNFQRHLLFHALYSSAAFPGQCHELIEPGR
jgi:hypothetical protein